MSSPKLHELVLSPRAQQDFIDILRYTGEQWGQQQLVIYRDKIHHALNSIRDHPHGGHQREDLPPTHWTYLVGSHIIVYRIGGDTIGVVRILHQRMSLARHL